MFLRQPRKRYDLLKKRADLSAHTRVFGLERRPRDLFVADPDVGVEDHLPAIVYNNLAHKVNVDEAAQGFFCRLITVGCSVLKRGFPLKGLHRRSFQED